MIIIRHFASVKLATAKMINNPERSMEAEMRNFSKPRLV